MSDYHYQASDLENRFLQRGYPPEVLNSAQNDAPEQDRSKLLIPRAKIKEGDGMRIITTYDGRSEDAVNIIKKYWDILKADPDLTDVITGRPQVTFRKGRSLKDRLIHSHYVLKRKEGTWLDRRPIVWW